MFIYLFYESIDSWENSGPIGSIQEKISIREKKKTTDSVER